MRKVLIHAWGADGRQWAGRSMTVYNDPTVKWAGEEVGGIRISHMTDIERDIKVSLTTTRGKKAKYEVHRLSSAVAGQLADITGSPTVEALKDNFGAAYKANKDASQRAQLKAAYDVRLATLTKPAVKTLAEFTDDIDNAADVEAANAVLESARDVLTPTEFEQLTEAHRIAWTA
jgi:hypothetical protein